LTSKSRGQLGRLSATQTSRLCCVSFCTYKTGPLVAKQSLLVVQSLNPEKPIPSSRQTPRAIQFVLGTIRTFVRGLAVSLSLNSSVSPTGFCLQIGFYPFLSHLLLDRLLCTIIGVTTWSQARPTTAVTTCKSYL